MKSKDWQLIIQMIALISQLGLTMVVSVGIAFFIGRFLDRLLGYSFFLTPFFMIIGVGAGFWSIYQLISRYFNRRKKDD
ncbi:hypothetical protein BBF96_11735 [Anoxybacter fermentans]|uniref:ATP synthase subunit n=1 Tax=Anoxybacter fermentans TaxID=1323375 RepID=A0A3Q9HRB0_9FIRM|nr:AtpZ/AtpI family protein [Anoxybacter fermentans]AZR74004.1 hypothetical protein BBF96_11735 [Anoxybacter fermentans]